MKYNIYNINVSIMFYLVLPFVKLVKILAYFINKCRYRSIHFDTYIEECIRITPECISFSKGCSVLKNARIEGVYKYNEKKYNPNIEFGENVTIQQGIHLTCANHIKICANTVIAAYVTITDINHPYEDINNSRSDLDVSEVYIGERCQIYNGAVILPGVKLGNHVIVGANTVVNKSIPDNSVVVGSPARIIKRFNPQSHKWEKTDKDGNYLTY